MEPPFDRILLCQKAPGEHWLCLGLAAGSGTELRKRIELTDRHLQELQRLAGEFLKTSERGMQLPYMFREGTNAPQTLSLDRGGAEKLLAELNGYLQALATGKEPFYPDGPPIDYTYSPS